MFERKINLCMQGYHFYKPPDGGGSSFKLGRLFKFIEMFKQLHQQLRCINDSPPEETHAEQRTWVCLQVSEPSTAASRYRYPVDSPLASAAAHILYPLYGESGFHWKEKKMSSIGLLWTCLFPGGVLTWLPFRPSHGSCPWVNISQRVTPNIQVSVAWENVLVFRLSGAHLQHDTKQTTGSCSLPLKRHENINSVNICQLQYVQR